MGRQTPKSIFSFLNLERNVVKEKDSVDFTYNKLTWIWWINSPFIRVLGSTLLLVQQSDRLCHPSRRCHGESWQGSSFCLLFLIISSQLVTRNGINTVFSPAYESESPPASAGRPYPVLATVYIRLHSSDNGVATEMFLLLWDEDRERAMSLVGALAYSDNGGPVLVSFFRALLESREITRLLMLMDPNFYLCVLACHIRVTS